MPLSTITEISLDINQPGIVVVHAKQYDTARMVKANLFYGGVKWNVPSSNFVAVVGFKKSDLVGGFYDLTEDNESAISVDAIDRSIITIRLDRNVVTTPGNVSVEITFYDAITSGRLSTFSFIVQVEPATVTELDLASNPYFNVLAEDIIAVIAAKQSMTGMDADATSVASSYSGKLVTVTGGGGADDPYVFHFKIPKGATGSQGPTGAAATISSTEIVYQTSSSGTVTPTGTWQSSPPTVPPGDFLWTRITVRFNSGSPVIWYSVAHYGVNGTGATSTVNSVSPDRNGNVQLTASDIPTSDSSVSVQDALNDMIDDAVTGTSSSWSSSKVSNEISALKPKVVTISAGATWSGSGPYTQRVTVTGGPATSKVDLQLSSAVLSQMISDNCKALYVENNNGAFTLYAVGAALSAAVTIQATVTEVR